MVHKDWLVHNPIPKCNIRIWFIKCKKHVNWQNAQPKVSIYMISTTYGLEENTHPLPMVHALCINGIYIENGDNLWILCTRKNKCKRWESVCYWPLNKLNMFISWNLKPWIINFKPSPTPQQKKNLNA